MRDLAGSPRSCAAPQPLVVGLPTRGSTVLGLDRHRATCLRGEAPECVFTLDVDTRAELRLSLETSNFDGALALYEARSGRELRCVDDTPAGDAHHARLGTTLTPGRYWVVVDGASGDAGDFELFTELEPLPRAADVCAHAVPLLPGAFVRDSTRGGINLFSATCGGGADGPEHVRVLSIEAPSRVRIRQQAEYDGSLYLRASCKDASSELACNDDFQTSASSLLTARLDPGNYYVFSDSYARDQSGDYVLALEQVGEPEERTVQETCTHAERGAPRLEGVHELDTLLGSEALAGSCGGEGAPELVLPIRVEVPTTLVAVLEEAELNAVMYLRRTCSDAASELACYVAPRVDHTSSESSPPALSASLERGTYVLVVDGYEPSDMGAATLRLLLTPGAR